MNLATAPLPKLPTLDPATPLVIGLAVLAVVAALLALLMALRMTCRARQALAHAEAASQAKSRFLATMSHELRTPLNAVIGAAQLLRADDGDALQRHQLIDAIQRSGGNLLGLIEDILDLSRIEAGALRLAVQDFHLGDCIDAALATAALDAQAKGLQLACHIDPALPQHCRGDAARLRQLLMNLLGNAVKFTPAGEVRLQVDPGERPGELRFQVQDSGVGIAPEALAQIFEPFRQGDERTGRRFGGSGLGLAIAAQLVRAMAGRIHVDSQPGVGACFTLWLPLPAADGVPPAPATADPTTAACMESPAAGAAAMRSVPQAPRNDAEPAPQVHVLVVEDDPLNQAIVSRLLRHAGCRVSTADDGLKALALLHDPPAGPPVDLVLMDWHMPGMDGLEVTRRLRAGATGDAAGRLPIIALTANAFAEDRAACLAAGMDDFLSKPVLAQTLLATVVRWARRPLAAPRIPEQPTPPAPRPAAPPAYDPSVLLALPMVADGSQPGCVNEVLEIFNSSLAELLQTLPQLIDQGQAEPVRRALHSLKSSAASVGALALAALAAEGEALLQDAAAQADAGVLGSPALQALPGRLCEASACWHLAVACTAAAAPATSPAPAAALRQREALTC